MAVGICTQVAKKKNRLCVSRSYSKLTVYVNIIDQTTSRELYKKPRN